jgi:hypothetical protein
LARYLAAETPKNYLAGHALRSPNGSRSDSARRNQQRYELFIIGSSDFEFLEASRRMHRTTLRRIELRRVVAVLWAFDDPVGRTYNGDSWPRLAAFAGK